MGLADLPRLSPPSFSPLRRTGIKVAILAVAALALIVGVAAVVVWRTGETIGKALGDVVSAVPISGAGFSAKADRLAHSDGVPDGALTLAMLNQGLPHVRWTAGPVGAGTGERGAVSVNAWGDHVFAAADPLGNNTCAFGLTVSSPTDPIIGLDQLPGPGTFWHFTVNTPTCSAAAPPTSGWVGTTR